MTNIDLRTLTDDELKAEMQRRELNKSTTAPEPLTEPNWLPVYKMAIDYIAQLEQNGFIDDDFEGYIFEAAMEAVYGEDVWKFINSRNQ